MVATIGNVPPRTKPDPYLAKLGSRIRTLRAHKKWSQEDLEEHSGVDRVFLSRIEKGVQSPSILTLRKLAKAFGTPIASLLPPETGH